MPRKTKNTTPAYLFKLAELCPQIAFNVSREQDHFFQWDGDGPSPVRRGYAAYDVIVKARAVCLGELIEGTATLGGSYYKPEEPMGDVQGYLPQMLLEAVEELASNDKVPGNMADPVSYQCREARLFLKQLKHELYEEQQLRSV